MMGGKGRRVFSNNYKGHMEKTKEGDGIRAGRWGELGRGKMKTTVLEQQLKKRKKERVHLLCCPNT